LLPRHSTSCSEQKCALDCIEATTTIRISCTLKCMLSLTMDAHERMERAAIPLMIKRCSDDPSVSSDFCSGCSSYGLGCSIAWDWMRKQRLPFGFGRPVFGQSGSRCDQKLVLQRLHVPPRFPLTHFLLLLSHRSITSTTSTCLPDLSLPLFKATLKPASPSLA